MAGRQRLDPELAVQLVEEASDAIVYLDMTATIVWSNPASDVLGWAADDLVGRPALELVQDDDLARGLRALEAMNAGYELPSSAPFNVMTATGETVECDVATWLIGDAAHPEGIGLHLRPTQDSRVLRRLLERLLAGDTATEVLGDMLDLLYHRNNFARVVVTVTDEDGADRTVGDGIDSRLGGVGATGSSPWARAAATGEQIVLEGRDQLPDTTRALAEKSQLRDCWILPVRSGDVHLATITQWTVEGGPPVLTDEYSMRLLTQLIELVLRWRLQTRDLERAATRDPLTGLPNRRALADFDSAGPRRNLGVLYIDLDRFKPVNDRLGHAGGDQVLRTVANRLQSAVRPTDIVARLGGDEFGIVCPGCSEDELEELAARVHELLADPIGVHADVVAVGSSIGVALGHDSVEPLLERADRALYDAKEDGRGTIRWAR